MAEQVGAAHGKECAEAHGHICVCQCRGALHGVMHRGGRPVKIERMGHVTVLATTHPDDVRLDVAGTHATTARQRAKHPVTVTVVQTDDPHAAGERVTGILDGGATAHDGPHVVAVSGEHGGTMVPRDLSQHSDDDLMQMFADLSAEGREDDLMHVWEEMGRRESMGPAEVGHPSGHYTPPKPYTEMSDEELDKASTDASTVGDEHAITMVFGEYERREQAEEARKAEARRPPDGPAAPESTFTTWLNLAGGPFASMGTSTPETQERAQRAMRLTYGLDQDAPDAEVYAAANADDRSHDLKTGWYIAWYRKLAAAEGISPDDHARYGYPDSAAGIANRDARLAEHRAAEVAKQSAAAAKDARAAALATPPAPALLRNPVADLAQVERMLQSYKGEKGVFEASLRFDEARRRTFLPDADSNEPDLTRKIAAAEKADPRSKPEKAAQLLAWYRRIGEVDHADEGGGAASTKYTKFDFVRGPADDRTDAIPAALTPANVAKPWATWQEIRDNAKREKLGGDSTTYDRYVKAMGRAYGLPDDATGQEIQQAYGSDTSTDNQKAALFIAAFRDLGEKDGVDRYDVLHYGPQDRGAGKKRPTQWAESSPEQVTKIEDLLSRGWDYLDAYAEVHNVDVEALAKQRASGLIDRAAGQTTADALKRMYDTHVHTQYVAAETAVRGHLLSKAGTAAGIDPITLFSGPTARARKYASEDLLRWWEANGGRTTYQQFRARTTGNAADKAAAKVTARAAQGKDFG